MHDINALERRWFIYKLKKTLKLLLPLLAILFIAFSVIYLYSNQEEKKQNYIETSKPTIKEQESQVIKTDESLTEKKLPIIENKSSNESKIVESKRVILKPSMNFFDDTPNIKPIINQDVTEEVIDLKEIENEVLKRESLDESESMSITKSTSSYEVEDIKKRFEKSKSIALGLFLAKHFYKTGDYESAYNYALRINEIDKSIEQSWIIFASSQAKMGNKDQAINVLNVYLKNNNSTDAKTLLNNIKRGTFK